MSEKISILMLIPYKNCFFPPFNFMKWAKIFFFSFLTKEKSMTYVEWSSHYSRINLQLIFEPFLQIGQWHLQMTKRKIPRNKTAKKIHPFLFHNRVKLKSIWIPFHGKKLCTLEHLGIDKVCYIFFLFELMSIWIKIYTNCFPWIKQINNGKGKNIIGWIIFGPLYVMIWFSDFGEWKWDCLIRVASLCGIETYK